VGAEAAVAELYRGLSQAQRREICFDWDHVDPLRGRLRAFVSNHWQVTPVPIRSDFFTRKQQHLIHDVFTSLVDPAWYPRFLKQADDDNHGNPWGADQSVGLFGDPDHGPFQCVITGRHMTLRASGNEAGGAAFGGPILYGHQASGLREEPHHPGNVFWAQALQASRLAATLDERQLEQAVLRRLPPETAIGFRPDRPGLAVKSLRADQRSELEKILAVLVEPFRAQDQARVKECLARHGGLDACHLMFGRDGRQSAPHWDNWRLEGPAFVWHFRGYPHVHVWVHVAEDPGALVQAQLGALLLRAAQGDTKTREPLIHMASSRLAEGDMQGAVSFATAALELPPLRAEGSSGPAALRPHEILYWALLWLGRRDEARPHFEKCLEADPSNPLYRSHARLFSVDPGMPPA
jgi:hypothetical protein